MKFSTVCRTIPFASRWQSGGCPCIYTDCFCLYFCAIGLACILASSIGIQRTSTQTSASAGSHVPVRQWSKTGTGQQHVIQYAVLLLLRYLLVAIFHVPISWRERSQDKFCRRYVRSCDEGKLMMHTQKSIVIRDHNLHATLRECLTDVWMTDKASSSRHAMSPQNLCGVPCIAMSPQNLCGVPCIETAKGC
jgi:hypothetical protein